MLVLQAWAVRLFAWVAISIPAIEINEGQAHEKSNVLSQQEMTTHQHSPQQQREEILLRTQIQSMAHPYNPPQQ